MTAAALKDLFERRLRALLKRPSLGGAAAQARAHLDGAGCDIEEGTWRARVSDPPEDGGPGGAPHPDQLMRASLAACLALGYRLWGARLDVPIAEVQVDVVCETDLRGQMGIAGVPIGWWRVVIDVGITSSAPEADVRRVVATADRLSPILANLSPAIDRVHLLRIIAPRSG